MPSGTELSAQGGLPLQPAELALECLETTYGASILLALEKARSNGLAHVRQADLIQDVAASGEAAFARDAEPLLKLKAVRRIVPESGRRAVFYAITGSGTEMLPIVDATELWGELGQGTDGGFEAVRDYRLISKSNRFWTDTVMIRLGLRESTLGQLADQLAPAISQSQLRRLLKHCYSLGLVTRHARPGESAYYGLTPWGRQMIRPVIIAHNWELRHIPERAAALPMINAQSGLKVTAELLRLPETFRGPVEFSGELFDVDRDRDGRATGRILKPTGRVARAHARFEAGRAVSVEVYERRVEAGASIERSASRYIDGPQPGWYRMIDTGAIRAMMISGRHGQKIAKRVHVDYTTPWE